MTEQHNTEPPQFAELFTWTMAPVTQVVTATRPNGETVRSDTRKISARDQRRVATHTLEWAEICERATRAKNAYHFIWMIDKSAIV